MSCNHCGVKFNFFHKEMGCANCGLSFCNKCLKQKCKIPSKGPQEQNVCKLCYSQIASGSSTHNTITYTPPDAYLNYSTSRRSKYCNELDLTEYETLRAQIILQTPLKKLFFELGSENIN